MKHIVLFLLLHCAILSIYAQDHSSSNNQRKPQDFLLNVFGNPSFSIYDFLCVGLNGNTTELLSEDIYFNHPKVKKIVKEKYGEYNYQLFHKIYLGLSYSWKVLLEVQNCNLDSMLKYLADYGPGNYEARRMKQKCPYPELRDKLNIIPLQMVGKH